MTCSAAVSGAVTERTVSPRAELIPLAPAVPTMCSTLAAAAVSATVTLVSTRTLAAKISSSIADVSTPSMVARACVYAAVSKEDVSPATVVEKVTTVR